MCIIGITIISINNLHQAVYNVSDRKKNNTYNANVFQTIVYTKSNCIEKKTKNTRYHGRNIEV